jgi:hypothetical protein
MEGFGTARKIVLFGRVFGLSSSNPELASLIVFESQAVTVRGSLARLLFGSSFYVGRPSTLCFTGSVLNWLSSPGCGFLESVLSGWFAFLKRIYLRLSKILT